MPVLTIADVYGIAGRRQELVAVLNDHARAAAAMDGCVRYTAAATLEDYDRFVLVGEWRDVAAREAYYASPSFKQYQFALNGLLARPSDATLYAIADVTKPVPSGLMDPRDAD